MSNFVYGKLDEGELESCELHVAQCNPCQDTISEIDLSQDTLGVLTKQAMNTPDVNAPDQQTIHKLVNRIQSLQFLDDGANHDANYSSDRAVEVERLMGPPKMDGDLGSVEDYRILELLGTGSSGVVYKGVHDGLQRPVAIKFLRPSLGMSARKRFMAEARATAMLNHPNVISIYEVGSTVELAFIVMEWCPGRTLHELLDERKSLSERETKTLGIKLAQGLAHAHQRGLIHRDIKPANVWVPDEGEIENCKILDFGLVRITDENPQLTCTGMIAGTPCFMSPEQSRGKDLDSRSDIFSLGCVLYQATTGTLPFHSANALSTLQLIQREQPTAPQEFDPAISTDFSDLIMCLLEKSPNRRPESSKDVAFALENPRRNWPFQPQSHREIHKPKAKTANGSFKWVAAVFACFAIGLAGWFYAPQIIRIATNQGEIVIETEVDDVKVEILKDGEQIDIIDLATQKSITIRAGKYEIQALGDDNSIEFSDNQLTLSRGGQAIVQVTQKSIPESASKGLNPLADNFNTIQPDATTIANQALDFLSNVPTHSDLNEMVPVLDKEVDITLEYPSFVKMNEDFLLQVTLKNQADHHVTPTLSVSFPNQLTPVNISKKATHEWLGKDSLSLSPPSLAPGQSTIIEVQFRSSSTGDKQIWVESFEDNRRFQWIAKFSVLAHQLNEVADDQKLNITKEQTEIELSVGNASVLALPEAYSSFQIHNPELAYGRPLAAQELLLEMTKAGKTSITIEYADKSEQIIRVTGQGNDDSNPVLQMAQSKILSLREQLLLKSQSLGEKHPQIQSLKKQVEFWEDFTDSTPLQMQSFLDISQAIDQEKAKLDAAYSADPNEAQRLIGQMQKLINESSLNSNMKQHLLNSLEVNKKSLGISDEKKQSAPTPKREKVSPKAEVEILLKDFERLKELYLVDRISLAELNIAEFEYLEAAIRNFDGSDKDTLHKNLQRKVELSQQNLDLELLLAQQPAPPTRKVVPLSDLERAIFHRKNQLRRARIALRDFESANLIPSSLPIYEGKTYDEHLEALGKAKRVDQAFEATTGMINTVNELERPDLVDHLFQTMVKYNDPPQAASRRQYLTTYEKFRAQSFDYFRQLEIEQAARLICRNFQEGDYKSLKVIQELMTRSFDCFDEPTDHSTASIQQILDAACAGVKRHRDRSVEMVDVISRLNVRVDLRQLEYEPFGKVLEWVYLERFKDGAIDETFPGKLLLNLIPETEGLMEKIEASLNGKLDFFDCYIHLALVNEAPEEMQRKLLSSCYRAWASLERDTNQVRYGRQVNEMGEKLFEPFVDDEVVANLAKQMHDLAKRNLPRKSANESYIDFAERRAEFFRRLSEPNLSQPQKE